jgi:DNA repair protein RecN (Recombination protein N)
MLRSLLIKNYALIDELTAEFSGGLVILTGETGAGKSILVDALGLILGERASVEVVRMGADRAIVEGTFAVRGNARLARLLREHELDSDAPDLIVRREVSAKGQSRCFLNDSPVTLSVMKAVGEVLVDLHGQHEHQSLLRAESHIIMLDDFGGLDGMVTEYQRVLGGFRALLADIDALRQKERQVKERREFSAFQLREIDAVAPVAGEEEELERELRILENAERLFATTAGLYESLYEGDRSVRDLLLVARNQLEAIAEIDERFAEAARECESAEAVIAELARFVQGYNARVEFNPERLEEIRERLGKLSLLKKKYGGTLDAVLAIRSRIAEELSLAEHYDEILQARHAEAVSVRAECAALAERLSVKRHEVARKLDRAIVQELKKLGIEHGRFSTRITHEELARSAEQAPALAAVTVGRSQVRFLERGYDRVEFAISTNLGEQERPLVQVASGGEVSRIMLALKSILAKADRLPVLVFDEIDVGVSGRIAQAVGKSLKQLSGFHQVIAITHLPQIAGLADEHFVVAKQERNGRTMTTVRKLTLEEQVHEVATLMSGARVTETGLAGARELMGLR